MALVQYATGTIVQGDTAVISLSYAAQQYGAIEFSGQDFGFVGLRCFLKMVANRGALNLGEAVVQTIPVYEKSLEFRIGERNVSRILMYVPLGAQFCTPYTYRIYRDE